MGLIEVSIAHPERNFSSLDNTELKLSREVCLGEKNISKLSVE